MVGRQRRYPSSQKRHRSSINDCLPPPGKRQKETQQHLTYQIQHTCYLMGYSWPSTAKYSNLSKYPSFRHHIFHSEKWNLRNKPSPPNIKKLLRWVMPEESANVNHSPHPRSRSLQLYLLSPGSAPIPTISFVLEKNCGNPWLNTDVQIHSLVIPQTPCCSLNEYSKYYYEII